MTRRTSSRVAGAMFLLYIVVGLTSVYVGRGTMSGDDTAAKLASIAAHAARVKVGVLLGFAIFCIALTLAIALYGITRDEDHELSLLATCCRVAEAVVGFVPVVATLALLDIAGAPGADAGTTRAMADVLFRVRRINPTMTALFFAAGSTVFSYLLARGDIVPRALAWLGIGASLLLVALLPAQLIGVSLGAFDQLIWLPMLVFEVALAGWLLVKGARIPARVSARAG